MNQPNDPRQPFGQPASTGQSTGPGMHFEQKPPKARRTVPLVAVLIGAPLLMIASCGIGSAASSSTSTAPAAVETVEVQVPGPVETVTAEPEPAPTVTVTAEAPEPVETSEPEQAPGVVGDGLWQIGTGKDIAPGQYRTVLPAEEVSGMCYAAVNTFEGDIVDNWLVETGYTIVNVAAEGDVFESSGCGQWEALS